jgi:rhodanese-related sulfurtransferase
MLPSAEESEITPTSLATLLAERGVAPLRLIDCREPEEYAYCHIEGAELVPLSDFAEQARLHGLLDETLPVIVYCHHGMRSLRATHFLRQRGLTTVWSLSGGIEQWSHDIDPQMPRY